MRKNLVTGLILTTLLVSVIAFAGFVSGDAAEDGDQSALQKGADSDGVHQRPRDQDNANDDVDPPRSGFGW